ncbi:MAG: hypothetical protein KDA84_01105 [Planctomycetaceae bacterium]|nr:hypothetical protein [Planctomycetaceae bacterium]
MHLRIDSCGRIRCLYAEMISLGALGRLAISRGSHVEPDAQGNWFANLSPVHGPRLGPFAQRSEALQAETQWLEANWLLPSPTP